MANFMYIQIVVLTIPLVFVTSLGIMYSNKSYALTSTNITIPLTPNEFQVFPEREIAFHLDNQTSGAAEVVENSTGQNKTHYLKYNLDRNSVIVSNSTIYGDFTFQIPYPNDPNTVKMVREHLMADVKVVTDHPQNKFKSYCGGGIQNERNFACVSIPYDMGVLTGGACNKILRIVLW